MILFLLGFTSGVLFTLLVAVVMVGKRVRRLKEEHSIIRERFDTAVAEFEAHMRRLKERGSIAMDKETIS